MSRPYHQQQRGAGPHHSGGPPHRPHQQQQQSQERRQGVVMTNCFKITKVPNKVFTMYDAFKPDIPRSKWRSRTELVHHLQHSVYADTFKPLFLYDGGAIGFARQELAVVLGKEREFPVRLRDYAPPARDAKNAFVVTFKISRAESITATEINTIFDGADSPRKESILNFMQLMVRSESNNLHANNGRAYFNRSDVTVLREGFLEVRLGVFHSVRPTIGQLVVVVDTTAAAFYRSGRMQDALMSVLRKNNLNDLNHLTEQDLKTLRNWFKGVQIEESKTGQGGRKGGKRTIKGFHPEGIMYEFENDDGHPITIKDHYKRLYNTDLRNTRWPGVIVREKPRLEILPLELCDIVPDQFFRKALPDWAAGEMVSKATLAPFKKKTKIMEAVSFYQQSVYLAESGMEVANQPVAAPATLLPTPQIKFNNSLVRVEDGKWNVVKKRLISSIPKCHWVVVNFASTRFGGSVLEQHIGTFMQCANELGIPLKEPLFVVSGDVSYGGEGRTIKSLDAALRRVEKEQAPIFKEMMQTRKFFVLCVLAAEAAGVRNEVKYWGDVLRGVITQCVRESKVAKQTTPRQASQYWNNVCLKINPRLGGENSRVEGSIAYTHLTKGVTMVVGADVGHPSPGVRKPSVASLVYSIDQFATKYNALTRLQEPRTEGIAELKAMMIEGMDHMMTLAKNPIHQIVFYRDGVSEGEYERVRQTEIVEIKAAITEVWMKSEIVQSCVRQGQHVPLPGLVFIVVGKRHHTLLFPNNAESSDKTGNCPAGVVVDQVITQPTVEDFYLLSHSAIIGTSRSSHYIVLCNEKVTENGLEKVFPNIGLVEDFSYALCHVYAKATRSVSIPAPVYYADLVCSRESFHFAPGVENDLRASDAGSALATGDQAPFQLAPWVAAFRPRNRQLHGNMYFL